MVDSADTDRDTESGSGQTTAETGLARPLVADAAGSPALAPGTALGRYVVIDCLGRGGMGVVYRAFDPELDRAVAVKLVGVGGDDDDNRSERRERLLREAQALARLSHPNVVAVYDVGALDDRVFLAMELVEGAPLNEWLATESPARARVLEVFLDAGAGLEAAHQRGLVHRDFKPTNVVIGNDGRARVLDFGLARDNSGAETLAGAGSSVSTPAARPRVRPVADAPSMAGDQDQLSVSSGSLLADPITLAGTILGTPTYMAPEQHRGRRVSASTDQFSFCVALYEALYGERPFAGTYRGELPANVLHGRVRDPPADAEVPTWLRRVLLRGLSPSPLDRYPSMGDLLAALRADPRVVRRRAMRWTAIAALAAVAAYGMLRGSSTRDPCAGAAAAAGLVWTSEVRAQVRSALLASGRSNATDTATRLEGIVDGYVARWSTLRVDVCRASRVRGEQSDRLLEIRMGCLDRRMQRLDALLATLRERHGPDVHDRAVEAALGLDPLDSCAVAAAGTGEFTRDPALRARAAALTVQADRASALGALGSYDPALTLADEVYAGAVELGDPALIAELAYLRSGLLINLGRYDDAVEALDRTIASASASHYDALVAIAWVDLLRVRSFHQVKLAEAALLARAAQSSVVRAGDPPRLRAELYHALALIACYEGERTRASDLATSMLEALEEAGAGDTVAVADALTVLAMAAAQQGDYARAEKLNRRALRTRLALLGDQHPRVADSRDNLGVTLFHQGRYDEALELYEQALTARRSVLGPTHADVGTSYNNLGALYLEREQYELARTTFERALESWSNAYAADHPDLAIPLGNLGAVALEQQEFDRALEVCSRSLALEEAAFGADNPELGYNLTCVGAALIGLERPGEAVDVLERALAVRAPGEVDPVELAHTRFALGRALRGARRSPERAQRLVLDARAVFVAAGARAQRERARVDAWLGR